MHAALKLPEILVREHELLIEDVKHRARNGLLNFTLYTFPGYEVNWHHHELCKVLNRFARGEIKRLIVCLPPRHGKSALVSVQLPAFLLGQNPDAKIIATSYSADLASRMNRDVQRLIDSPQFTDLFPNTFLSGSNVRTTAHGSWLRNSDIFEVVGRKGIYRSAGVGGGITGMGANCFPAGTLIETDRGRVDIADFIQCQSAPRVLSYNHENELCEWQLVEAVRTLEAQDFVEIETTGGRKFSCTPDHRVYSPKHGYREARVFCEGDTLERVTQNLRLVHDTVSVVRWIRGNSKPVYDLQIAKNRNFFANEILVHNCVIIDDPIKNQKEADSTVFRNALWDWYKSTLYTRLEKDANVLVTVTRWHEDDLVGRLLELAKSDPGADQWEVVSLPAVAEGAGSVGPLSDPRVLGDPLWPGKYSPRTLASIKSSVGSRTWAALYQQRPAPEEGMIIKREWWRFYQKPPEAFDLQIQAWDLRFSENAQAGDYVVGVLLGRHGANIYLLDMVRGRLGFTESLQALRNFSRKWPAAEAKYIERAANGFALIETLRTEIPGLIAVPPLGSKVARANAVAPRIEAGNVWLPDPKIAPWVSDVIEEWAAFPAGTHDDIVDAMSHGLAKIGNMVTDWLPISLGNQMTFPREMTELTLG